METSSASDVGFMTYKNNSLFFTVLFNSIYSTCLQITAASYLKTMGPGGHQLNIPNDPFKTTKVVLFFYSSFFHLRPILRTEVFGQVARSSDSH